MVKNIQQLSTRVKSSKRSPFINSSYTPTRQARTSFVHSRKLISHPENIQLAKMKNKPKQSENTH